MTITPCRLDRAQNQTAIAQFLATCKRANLRKSSQIVSISLEIEPIDPLAVLQAIVRPDQRHFYFEKSGQQEAILAIDTTIELKTEGKNRFVEAKEFIRSASTNAIQFGDSETPFSGTHFFCSFSFFDQPLQENLSFPSASVFLPRWQVSRQADRCTIVANVVIDQTLDPERSSAQIWQKFQTIRAVKHQAIDLAIGLNKLARKDFSHTNHFKKSVLSVLESIQKKHLHKIVLAHALDVTLPIPFNLVNSLNNLRRLYSNCYIFSTNNSQGQTFIGASPERLVKIHNQHLETDALAGSAPRGKTAIEDIQLADRLLSSQKETHEHQVVIDFITRHLEELGLNTQRSSARLLQLPNIQHLHTPIRATVPSRVHLLDVVAKLHPTPAVAGAPRELACEQIRHYEQFERSLYAAPIGWVDQQGNGEFAVGIRSAVLNGCHARLFAGAGIVAGSNPDKELTEVQLKLQALLAALV
ncbi:isochorismate synthase [Phormidesmis priestleyi ULC007]|uniref:isochorismate synthase n=1 Tax=Phormidesmis priestleyi ULC007 TaxID=1920490 RepID=A0A2T1DLR5_9CYAN|nr:isochorismate synthase [Phormidesmis priestleyi]PSB21447.1 isochorismate synthase [Phormidesmis priestleyi ULC007]PZO48595.1 MAG: isochorismate synthase [Phormidesmis priestleyi]